MADVSKSFTFTGGLPARPSQVNQNYDEIIQQINDLEIANIKTALINAANGIVQLDASAKVPVALIPTIVEAMIGVGAVTEGKIEAGAVTQGKIGNSAVGQAQLKTTTGSVYVSMGSAHRTLPGGGWAFYPATKGNANYIIQIAKGSTISSYATIIYISCPTGTGNAQVNYIQASPPYEIEHFIYLLLEKGNIISGWEAPDPPWYGQGFEDKATEQDFPHPFIDKKDNQKVILVNPSAAFMSELKSKKKQFRKSYLELINEGNYMIEDKLEKARGKVTEKLIGKGIEFRKLTKK